MLHKFLESWTPKTGENHKIDFQALIDDVTDETLTHYYINFGDINDNPLAVAESNDIRLSTHSVPPDVGSTRFFFTDRLFYNIEQNKFAKEVRLSAFYLDEMDNDTTFDEFLDFSRRETKKKHVFKYKLLKSQKMIPFLLKNDSLLIYSIRKCLTDSSNKDDLNNSDSLSSSFDDSMNMSSDKIDRTESIDLGEAEAFISFSLYEYKHLDENEKINITIGRNVLSQITPDSLSKKGTNFSLFDHRFEKEEEVINTSISEHIFKQIIPDPLSSNRFFFVAFKVLYLAEIVGSGQKRHLEVFKIFSEKSILKYDVSETAICYLTENEEGCSIFEVFYRTDDISPKKVISMERLFAFKPDSFFLFNNTVIIKPHGGVPCKWNIKRKDITDSDENINFFLPISKDCIARIYFKDGKEKILIENESNIIDCDKDYDDDVKIVANSKYILIIDKYGIEQIPFDSKKKILSKKIYSFNECLNTIQNVINNQNEKLNEFINRSSQISDEIIDRIKKIEKNISNDQ